MKNVLFLFLILLFNFSFGFSQINNNSFSIGFHATIGSTNSENYNSNYDDYYKTNSSYYFIQPQIGYSPVKNFLINFGLEYGRNKSTQNPPYAEEYSSESMFYSFFSNIKYYKNFSKQIVVFSYLSFNVGFGNSKNQINNTETEFEDNNFSLGVTPGFEYFLSKKIGLEFTLGHLRYSKRISKDKKNNNKPKNKNESFILSCNLSSMGLAVRYYF